MSIESKQEFLRREIVEAGYDPEIFYEFWENFSIDINEASMHDLQAVVKEFQSKQAETKGIHHEKEDEFGDYVEPQQQTPSHFYQDFNWDFLTEKKPSLTPHKPEAHKDSAQKLKPSFENPKRQPPLSKVEPKPIEELSQEERNSKLQDFVESLKDPSLEENRNNVTFGEVLSESKSEKRKCLKLQPNLLDHHSNLEILITDCQEIIEGNPGLLNKLWKGPAQIFNIRTIGRNKQRAIGISWEVKRMYSDFEWLRNMLSRVYPGLVIPPLPLQSRTASNGTGFQHKLVSFLLDCYHCPELRNSKYFEVFLSYSSTKDFDSFKKNSEGTSKPKDLTHILNMEGEIKLLYSGKIDEYSQGLQRFLNNSSQHLKNVKSTIQEIEELYTSISEKYKKLGDELAIMSEESCSFSLEECYPRLTETYKQISNLVRQHSQFCLHEKDFIETYMFSHFAYEKDRIDNMHTLITKRKTFAVEFLKPKHQQPGPKPEPGGSMFGKIVGLFGEKAENLDLPSSDTQTLKDQVGFYNSQLMKESIRCVEGMISSHVSHFSAYGHSRIDNIDQMQKIWSQVLVELSKLRAR